MNLRFLAFGALLALSGCAEFPDVDAATSPEVASADYPQLLPFEDILTGTPPQSSQAISNDLQARADALRARADRLRAPVIDGADQRRMDEGVDTAGL